LLALVYLSCNSGPRNKTGNDIPYFNIPQYFNNEVARLQKLNPNVFKTVATKDKIEKSTTKIADWKAELAGFVSSDINKAAWRGDFKEKIQQNSVTYTTSNLNIPIKKIEIIKDKKRISAIKIYRSNNNYLYHSADT